MWGDTNYSASFSRSDLTGVVAIAVGQSTPTSMALRSDGSLAVWGDNTNGQTNLPLVLTNAMGIAAGNGHCLALLGDGSPHLCRPLANQTAELGSTVTFNSSAVGIGPLGYQWQFDGLDLPQATNALLVISNMSAAAQGMYSCCVSNSLGAVFTAEAKLTLRRPPLTFAIEPGAPLLADDGLHLKLLNVTGASPVVLEASDDLQHWEPILTNPPAVGVLQLIDPGAHSRPRRYYRAFE